MDEKFKRTQSLITILTDIILIVISFIMLIDSIIGEKSIILVKQNINYIFSNLNLLPIEDFIDATWQCPMEYEPIYNGINFGSNEGCYVYDKKSYLIGTCSSNHISKLQGRDISAVLNSPIKIWRNGLICLKRYTNATRLMPEKDNKTCPDQMKYCGKVDKFGNFLCVFTNSNCPVTSIIISNETAKIGYQSLRLEKNYKFTFSKNIIEEELIPIDFSISLDYPCLKVDSISNITEPIDLVFNISKVGCNPSDFNIEQLKKYDANITEIDLKDKRYWRLDSYKLFQFLKDNDLFRDLSENYKEYYEKYNYKEAYISFYARNYIGQNKTCSDDDNYIAIEERLLLSKDLQFKLLLMELINITILCFFISLLSLVKTKIMFNLTHILMSYLKIILAGLFIFFNIYIVLKCIKLSDKLVKLISDSYDNKCFDISTNFALEVYNIETKLGQTTKYNQFLFWGSIVYASCVFIQFVRLSLKTYFKIRYSKKMTFDAKNVLSKHLNE